MALPYTFASLTTILSTYWDANYSALGALVPIPCSVAGTNAITLTPLANTPTVTSYANYMQFSGIVASSNSGAVTAAAGSLTALAVYKDTASGPVALSGGELIANTAFTLMYDNTLNSGAGGFHVIYAPTIGSFLPLSGGTLSGGLVGTTISLTGGISAQTATIGGLLTASTATIAGVMKAATITATGGISGTAATVTGLVSAGSLQVNSGATVSRLLTALNTITFATIPIQGTADQTVTLTGVSVGDVVMAAPPSSPTVGLVLSAFVSATNSVVLRFANPTTATLVAPAGTYRTTAIGAGP